MKKLIDNPYKVNNKLYCVIFLISILLICLGYLLSFLNCLIFSEIFKNLGFGSFASTLVALLIEIDNVSDKNKKLAKIYDMAYNELQFSILKYLETWSEFCCIASNDKYKANKNTWLDWYKLSKTIFYSSDKKTQSEFSEYLINNLLNFSVNNACNSLKFVLSQRHILEVSDVYNSELDRIIKDFDFEFGRAKSELEIIGKIDDFWKAYDEINSNFYKYIDRWSDISYYNELKIMPWGTFDDNECINALLLTEKKKNRK